MIRKTVIFVCFVSAIFCENVKIKNIVTIAPIKSLELVGFGIIGGLEGKGDTDRVKFTNQAIANMLKKFNISITKQDIKSKNVASVAVQGYLNSYTPSGYRFDVTVISIGDAKSLKNGYLIQTPLFNASGELVAIAYGSVITEGENKIGRIPNGGVLLKDYIEDSECKEINLILKSPDFTTAYNIANSINQKFNNSISTPISKGIVKVKIPQNLNYVEFISQIENLTVNLEIPPKVVIDQKSGTIVMGQDVIILPVAFTHKNIKISIGQKSSEGTIQFISGIKVEEFVSTLNRLGLKPEDIISIFQTLKSSGALQADLEIQ
ncbi:MAG: flagellar basal body P-ring protein FlgI [bacterium]|nr:flagellar basal body P-ring protein FlgI [bacterium]MDW8164212.1 flagellar basal body P-ring protein FlgI [Candidatus Omnitrophota bacterium]